MDFPAEIDGVNDEGQLGNYLMQHDLLAGPIRTDIFLSHTPWDHQYAGKSVCTCYDTEIFFPGRAWKC